MIAKLKAVPIKEAMNLNHSSFLCMKTAEKLKLSYNSVYYPFTNWNSVTPYRYHLKMLPPEKLWDSQP